MKVYFINLDRSPARREWMESQLTEISANFERIPAVDGSSLASEEYEAAVNWEELGPKGLTRGEVGCFLSHRLAWQRIAAASERFGVVLEDDILISKNGDRFLSDDSWIPDGAAQVRLETNRGRVDLKHCRGSGRIGGIRYKLFEFQNIPGAGAYILHRELAAWLVTKFDRIAFQVDEELARHDLFLNGGPRLPGGAFYRLHLVPALAIQQCLHERRFLPDGAEVTTMHFEIVREKVKISDRARLMRELKRLVDINQYKRVLRQKRVPLMK